MGLGRAVSTALLLLLLVGRGGAQIAAENAAAFPVPAHIVTFSDVVTPQEYAKAIRAIRTYTARPAVQQALEEGAGIEDLDWIYASRVSLGALGEGLVVNFLHSAACGTGGCPMWLLVRDQDAYKVAVPGAGWGYWLKSSGGPVPDLILYWQMGVGDTDVAHYRYGGGKFIGVRASPERCAQGTDTGDCAGIENASHIGDWTVAPAEYASLDEQFKTATVPALKHLTGEFAERAHAIDLRLVNNEVARVVGVGDCRREGNCTISIYGCNQTYPNVGSLDPEKVNLPACRLWPMLTGVSGWGVANVSDWSGEWVGNIFSMRLSFVVARRISDGKTELARYSAFVKASDPKADVKLTLDSCEVLDGSVGAQPAKAQRAISVSELQDCER